MSGNILYGCKNTVVQDYDLHLSSLGSVFRKLMDKTTDVFLLLLNLLQGNSRDWKLCLFMNSFVGCLYLHTIKKRLEVISQKI
jgi:hypothetical protein